MEPDPTLRPDRQPEDTDRALRPQTLDDFIGQAEARANLRVFIESARRRGEAMDHTLFHGPPGLGKTTLAQIIARELGVGFRMTSGPVLAKAGRPRGDPDEPRAARRALHRRDPPAEPGGGGGALSRARGFRAGSGDRRGAGGADGADRVAALHAGGGHDADGASDHAAARPLRHPDAAQFYEVAELHEIVTRGARLLGIPAAPEGTLEIARRARGTPRIAGRLLRRVVDFAVVEGDGRLTREIADRALTRLGVDHLGLDGADRRYLGLVAENYAGGPVGVETLSAALSESRDSIEEVIEPFLLQQGLIQRTPRGRMLAAKAWTHLGLVPAEVLALNQAVQGILLWSDRAFNDRPMFTRAEGGRTILRPEIAEVIRAVYDPVMPVTAREPAHALRVAARIAQRPPA
jgi:holliday junction DNA helicase RuvB